MSTTIADNTGYWLYYEYFIISVSYKTNTEVTLLSSIWVHKYIVGFIINRTMLWNILNKIISFKHSGNLHINLRKREAPCYRKLTFLVLMQDNHYMSWIVRLNSIFLEKEKTTQCLQEMEAFLFPWKVLLNYKWDQLKETRNFIFLCYLLS